MTASIDQKTGKTRWFLVCSLCVAMASYIFFDGLAFKKDLHDFPFAWSSLLAGHGSAPEQYRLGVLFVAGAITRLSHGHLALRYSLTVLDCLFLIAGLFSVYLLITRNRLYRQSGPLFQVTIQSLTVGLLLYYMSWTLWYHKPETIANFALLALAAVLLSGYTALPTWLSCVGLLVCSIYLGTIRADSGFALNLGMLVAALALAGSKLPLGRVNHAVIAIFGIIADIGVEFYIKHFLYPSNQFSDALISIKANFTSPLTLFCVLVAFAPFFYLLFLARRFWKNLEGWESALLFASLAEFLIFIIVAHAREVRLFLPFPMVLSSATAILFCRYFIDDPSLSEMPQDRVVETAIPRGV